MQDKMQKKIDSGRFLMYQREMRVYEIFGKKVIEDYAAFTKPWPNVSGHHRFIIGEYLLIREEYLNVLELDEATPPSVPRGDYKPDRRRIGHPASDMTKSKMREAWVKRKAGKKK
jgi:hypothetical protein